VHQEPVPQDPGRDDDPSRVSSWPDWIDDPAYLAARAADEDLGDMDEAEDPDNAPPPGLDDDELDALIAEAREITADQARAAEAAAQLDQTAMLAALGAVAAGRRGPGMSGSAQSFPEECHISFARVLRTQALRTPGYCRARLPRHRPQPMWLGLAFSQKVTRTQNMRF
jgi:hypothetical protein